MTYPDSKSEDLIAVLDIDALARMTHPTALQVVERCIGIGGVDGADGRSVLGSDGSAGLDVEVEQLGKEEVRWRSSSDRQQPLEPQTHHPAV